ncbi:hypothetical protein KSP39_PZI008447 [Platanthera zijinensis]|uniref:CCHC-type domain-containing protein n=1 Tax=Platanthera zijinensis TaxID=2320716 RepID=A0AAP0BMS1_9ASPA
MLNPIKGPKEWPQTDLNLLVSWTVKSKKPGRPSLHGRRLEQDELDGKKYGLKRHETKYACSNCGVTGHNKKSCTQSSKNAEQPLSTTSKSKLPVKKKTAKTDYIATQESGAAPFRHAFS